MVLLLAKAPGPAVVPRHRRETCECPPPGSQKDGGDVCNFPLKDDPRSQLDTGLRNAVQEVGVRHAVIPGSL